MTARLIAVLMAAGAALAQVAQIPWDVQQDRPVAHDLYVWQGETVDLLPRLVQGVRPVAVTNAPVEFRYREASLPTNTYRYVAALASTNSGVVAVRWLPDYDAGAAWYDYQIIVGSNALNPRCFGRITMRQTIGWAASTNAPPPVTLYPTRADLQAVSNALAGALQHGLTNTVPAQIAAAVAGCAPPSPDALRLVDSTNAPSRWIDATGGVWSVSSAYGWTVSIPELAVSFAVPDLTFPLNVYEQVFEVDGLSILLGVELSTGDSYDFVLACLSDYREWFAGDTQAGIGVALSPLYGAAESDAYLVYTVVSATTNVIDGLAYRSDLGASSGGAWTNSLLYASGGTNYYPRWSAALQTYVVTGVPQ